MKQWKYKFDVPDNKKIRMIVYTDCKNEADDQFALVHHLMTPKFIIKGIIAGHFNRRPHQYGEGNTAQASMDEVKKILQLMELEGDVPVYKGAEYPLENEKTARISDAAKFIIEEAMREDTHPLFIACQGAVTDLASAILIQPEICEKITAIWIGGGAYPEGGFEFNLMQDITAANVIFCSSMKVWQIPVNAYKNVNVSLAELQYKVSNCGAIGEYLFEQMIALNMERKHVEYWPQGETWVLGDSPTIGVLLMQLMDESIYDMVDAPRVDPENMKYLPGESNRKIRVYHEIDEQLIIRDFFAKLALNFGR